MDSRSLARVGFAGVVGAAALLSWTATTPAQAAMFKCGKTGGDLVFAQDAQVAGLDQHFSTAISTRNIATHLYESLMTRGENNAVVPLLAESYSESDDGLTYSFKLAYPVNAHDRYM